MGGRTVKKHKNNGMVYFMLDGSTARDEEDLEVGEDDDAQGNNDPRRGGSAWWRRLLRGLRCAVGAGRVSMVIPVNATGQPAEVEADRISADTPSPVRAALEAFGLEARPSGKTLDFSDEEASFFETSHRVLEDDVARRLQQQQQRQSEQIEEAPNAAGSRRHRGEAVAAPGSSYSACARRLRDTHVRVRAHHLKDDVHRRCSRSCELLQHPGRRAGAAQAGHDRQRVSMLRHLLRGQPRQERPIFIGRRKRCAVPAALLC